MRSWNLVFYIAIFNLVTMSNKSMCNKICDAIDFPSIIFTSRRIPKKKVHRAKCLSIEKLFFRYLITLSRSTCTDQQFILVPVRTPPRYKVFFERSLRAAMIFHLYRAGMSPELSGRDNSKIEQAEKRAEDSN